MDYAEAKVYFDGSHYIAIPHTEKKKKDYTNERIEKWKEVAEKEGKVKSSFELMTEETASFECNVFAEQEQMSMVDNVNDVTGVSNDTPVFSVSGTDKEKLFEDLYKQSIGMKGGARREFLLNKMKDCFEDVELAEKYVDVKLERKLRNRIVRRTRMARKAYLAKMNYFCTFTYDDRVHNEDTFRKQLKTSFRHLCNRKGWKYIGVWERAPDTNRLHFHGLFHIPDGSMLGLMYETEIYSFADRKRKKVMQNSYFLQKFGRNEFDQLYGASMIGSSIAYITKYIEKSGERVVYSKNLPQYFISDIMGEDVVCKIGLEDRKLLLFDDFTCWDEGELIGEMSDATKKLLRTSN